MVRDALGRSERQYLAEAPDTAEAERLLRGPFARLAQRLRRRWSRFQS